MIECRWVELSVYTPEALPHELSQRHATRYAYRHRRDADLPRTGLPLRRAPAPRGRGLSQHAWCMSARLRACVHASLHAARRARSRAHACTSTHRAARVCSFAGWGQLKSQRACGVGGWVGAWEQREFRGWVVGGWGPLSSTTVGWVGPQYSLITSLYSSAVYIQY